MVRTFVRGDGRDACTIEQSDQRACSFVVLLYGRIKPNNIGVLAQQSKTRERTHLLLLDGTYPFIGSRLVRNEQDLFNRL